MERNSDQPIDKILTPQDNKGEIVEIGDDLEIRIRKGDSWETYKFKVAPSEHKGYFELIETEDEVADSTSSIRNKAAAYFRKGKEISFNLVPDILKGEEGAKFRKIASALGVAATSGVVGAVILIRRHKK